MQGFPFAECVAPKSWITGVSVGRVKVDDCEIVSQGIVVKPHLFHINAEFTIPELVIDF